MVNVDHMIVFRTSMCGSVSFIRYSIGSVSSHLWEVNPYHLWYTDIPLFRVMKIVFTQWKFPPIGNFVTGCIDIRLRIFREGIPERKIGPRKEIIEGSSFRTKRLLLKLKTFVDT